MKAEKMLTILLLALGLLVWQADVSTAEPMGRAWTYQGRLLDANGPPDGLYDFEFKLFDDSNTITGNQLGSTIYVDDLDVIDGYFTAVLDFNDPCAFNGEGRWLEIDARPGNSIDPNAFVTLSPRQKVTPTPYALYAKTAGNAPGGSGTTNRIAKFTGINTLGDSALYEHNYYVGVGTTNPRGMFDVDCDGGDIYLDTFGAKIYIGDVGGDGDETLFTVHDGSKFTFENGSVGIGTVNPLNDLHVYDSGGNAYVLTESDSGFAFFIADGNNNSGLTIKENGVIKANVYWDTLRQLLSLTEGNNDRLVVKGENVGIGTSSPDAKLEVNGEILISPDSQSKLRIGRYSMASRNSYISAIDAYQMHLQIENSTKMAIDTSGNVGIGTTNPGSRLDVKSTGTTADIIRGTASDDSLLFNVQENGGHGVAYIRDNAGSAKVQLYSNGNSYFTGGNVGIGTTSPATKLHVVGMARVEAVQITGADVAEKFPVSEEVSPGMVVTIDTENPGQLCLSRGAYNRCVAGVVSGAKGLPAGAILGNLPGHEDAVPIALSGRVWVYCDATEKAIEPGDMLTTSPTVGHAMAVTDYTKAHGAVLGKAMTSLEQGQAGLVLTLINLQ